MTGSLYTLRYRQGQGVVTTFIEAENDQMAKLIGETYVNQIFNSRFIGVTKAISADASILTKLGIPVPTPQAAPDDESDLPMKPKAVITRTEPPIVPINPGKERALDAEQEAEDLRELKEAERLAAAGSSKSNKK